MKVRLLALVAPVVFAACADTTRTPTQPDEGAALVLGRVSNVSYASGTTPVTAYDPIIPAAADPTWPTTTCKATPAVGPNANWLNPHPAVTGLTHPWINSWFTGAGWINAWGVPGTTPQSQGPGGQSWTKYTTQVQGNGSFVIQLLADNCSWIYLDGTLVGVQNTNPSTVSYGLTLNGTHTLTFVIFDGGGAAGGKFKLETTTNPPPPLNNDLDNDGHQNNVDDFPLDPTRWDADNLVANGSFEHPAIKAGPWPLPNGVFPWQTFASPAQGLTGWTVEANTVDTQRGEVGFQFTGVPDGLQVLDLNNGRISQAVATTANYRYRVSFSLSKNYVCASGNVRVLVAFGGASQEFTFSAGGSAQNMTWNAHPLDAVSTGASETLRFTATAFGGCGGPMLDAVRVESMGPADNTPPTIVPNITGTQGTNGWYTSNVGVSWTVTDNESAVTSTDGCGATSVTTDTQGVTFTCKARSAGGEASESVTIKRDATHPAIDYSGNAYSYTVDQTVAITCTASDAMSGLASDTCANISGAAYTFNIGINVYSASAYDNAGNKNTASTGFTVTVTSGSLCTLVQRWVSNAGVANSLCVKLRQGSYGAFRNEVSAQSGKKFLSADHAAILLQLVNELD